MRGSEAAIIRGKTIFVRCGVIVAAGGDRGLPPEAQPREAGATATATTSGRGKPWKKYFSQRRGERRGLGKL